MPAGGWALVGAGSGLVLIGSGCGAGALATAGQFDGMPLTRNQINDLTAQGNALNAAAIVLDVVGGLALTAGTGWLVWHRLHTTRQAIALHPTGLQFAR
jgi:hypothetical protein